MRTPGIERQPAMCGPWAIWVTRADSHRKRATLCVATARIAKRAQRLVTRGDQPGGFSHASLDGTCAVAYPTVPVRLSRCVGSKAHGHAIQSHLARIAAGESAAFRGHRLSRITAAATHLERMTGVNSAQHLCGSNGSAFRVPGDPSTRRIPMISSIHGGHGAMPPPSDRSRVTSSRPAATNNGAELPAARPASTAANAQDTSTRVSIQGGATSPASTAYSAPRSSPTGDRASSSSAGVAATNSGSAASQSTAGAATADALASAYRTQPRELSSLASTA